jgi:hypothetical protein
MRYRLAMWALCCSVAAAESLNSNPDVSLIVLLTGDAVTPLVLNAMEREVEATVAPSGLKLSWESREDLGDDSVVNGRMAIIRMRGQCNSQPPIGADTVTAAGGAELGVTHIVNGRILPFADVLCSAVRQLVERDLRGVPIQGRDALLGRALGRVLAHELYHILVQTADHGNDGLSRQRQSSADLLVPHRSFVLPDQRRIGESIRGNLYGFAASDSGR